MLDFTVGKYEEKELEEEIVKKTMSTYLTEEFFLEFKREMEQYMSSEQHSKDMDEINDKFVTEGEDTLSNLDDQYYLSKHIGK